MTPATITRALYHLPATREELAAALGVKEAQGNAVAKHLIDQRYAEEWGTRLTTKGTLAPILCPTGKQVEINSESKQ